MQITCPECQRELEYPGEQPRYCCFCGYALTETAAPVAQDGGHTLGADVQVVTRSRALSMQSPQQVGDYRLLRKLGQGGMGVVWEAEQAGSGRRVALKLLSPRLVQTPETIERFLREGRLAAAVSHPRSTFVFGAGRIAEQPYIAMELMPGRTLQDVLHEEGRLPYARAVGHILDVIDGLMAAHAIGVIHRDVKPSNCFVDSDGRIKIGDFGLSKSVSMDSSLTRTGAFMGTPLFAAPEQVRGKEVDTRTDIYSVGATLFYLIANRGPFEGDLSAVIAQIASEPPPSVRKLVPCVPQELARVIGKALEKQPSRRYATLGELRRALLPFAPSGTAMAQIGRRVAAYMIDSLLASYSAGVLLTAYTTFGIPALQARGLLNPRVSAALVPSAIMFVLQVLYFTVAEGRWGRGVGKQLLGLRVVGPEGERPGVLRALLRSLLIPGSLGASFAWPAYQLLVASPAPDENAAFDPLQTMLLPMAMGMLPLLVWLVCMTSMRARSGYRGWHELVSGTRVVRLMTGPKRPKGVGSLFQAARNRARASEPTGCGLKKTPDPLAHTWGPFAGVSELGRCPGAVIYLARDDLLDRSVWVFVRSPEAPDVSAARMAIVRPTRPRWLQSGADASERWDAYEAVEGSPLEAFVRHQHGFDWTQARELLLDLANELSAAQFDGTLPESLSLAQVWVDGSGRLKLLDLPLASSANGVGSLFRAAPSRVESSKPASGGPKKTPDPLPHAPVFSGAERAAELLRAAAECSCRGRPLPVHAQEFLDRLRSRRAGSGALAWAIERLQALNERRGSLRWDDRLGVLAFSAAAELLVYMLPSLVLAWLLWSHGGLTEPTRLAILATVCTGFPAALGFLFCGGPVFGLMKIAVQRRDSRPAGRLRCGWRSFVAWAPFTLGYTLLGWMIGIMTAAAAMPADPTDPLAQYAFLTSREFLIASSYWAPLIPFVLGGIYAVVRPTRGIQDLLAGTRLAPR